MDSFRSSRVLVLLPFPVYFTISDSFVHVLRFVVVARVLVPPSLGGCTLMPSLGHIMTVYDILLL